MDLAAFYSEHPVRIWRQVLGSGMHYHFGLFREPALPVDDDRMDAALDHAVRAFYPHIPEGSRVLDVGCGWGGSMRMLNAERSCRVVGLTNSTTQQAWCREQGLEAELGDVQEPEAVPRGPFDIALLLESLSHVSAKGDLLTRLATVADRLVVRANCNEARRPAPAFGGSMFLMPVADLMAQVEDSGWTVVETIDRRDATMPTFDGWAMRLDRLGGELTGQLRILREFCDHARRWGAVWAASNPLLDIVAERS